VLAALQKELVTAVEPFFDESECELFDFPDYANVGDSAIYLGELDLISRMGVNIRDVHSLATFSRNYESVSTHVLFQGGGNLGGLYPNFDAFRLMVLDNLSSDHKFLVLPQSISKSDDTIMSGYQLIAQKKEVTFLARDHSTAKILGSWGLRHRLAPDAAHFLGPIECPAPVRKYVVLKRTDDESAVIDKLEKTEDWLTEGFRAELGTKLRSLGRFSTRLARTMALSKEKSFDIASSRLDRGVLQLSRGETIVTDRLHAMIIGLQMGRQVIAIDNSHKKLSNYASTWELNKLDNLEFRSNFTS